MATIKAISPERVSTFLEEWRQRFHLQAWEIKLECVPDENVTCPDNDLGPVAAWVMRERSWRAATICIATCRPWADVQRSVVHELLHLLLVDLCDAGRMLYSEVSKALTEIADETIEQAGHDVIYTLISILLEQSDGD